MPHVSSRTPTPTNTAKPRRVILSGCSSGGKSTLLGALSLGGHATVPEPGRRVLTAGGPDPERDPAGFGKACIALALSDLETSDAPLVFFDRGLLDAHLNLASLGVPSGIDPSRFSFHSNVLMAPPWPEIYVQDDARRHGLDAAIAEYEMLVQGYSDLGYEVTVLPKTPVEDRLSFVGSVLGLP
ncbi:MAG: AAA family ATPase [Pseudomonadota bacterium]